MNEAVQKDLKLTATQTQKLQQIEETMRAKRREMFEGAGEERPDPQTVMAAMTTLRRQQDAAIAKVLDKSQKTRLSEIELQRDGIVAVARKEIATKLKITAVQSKKIQAIIDDMRIAQRTLMPQFGGGPPGGGGFPGGGGPPPGGPGGGDFGGGPPPGGGPGGDGPFPGGPPGGGEGGFPGGPPQGEGGRGFPGGGPPGAGPDFNNPEMRAQFAKMREAQDKLQTTATKKIKAVLTKDQKAAFDEMLGEPFDLSTLRRGPGGPGGGSQDRATTKGTQSQAKTKARRETQ
jgi:hypothetical protein